MNKNIINFFTPLRLRIYGIILMIPALIINLKYIFDTTPASSRFIFDSVVKNFEILIMMALYLGIVVILLSINRFNSIVGKIINIKYFRWLIYAIILIVILALAGFINLQFPAIGVCDKTYDVHGDGPQGPVYVKTICVSYAYPWNIIFWPTIIKGGPVE